MRQTLKLTAVRLPADMVAALDQQAQQANVTRSQLQRDVLADWLAERGVSVRRTAYREQQSA